MIRVKICGITNVTDAMLCCDYGADALGFVFYPDSPRYVTASQSEQIIRQLSAFVSTVGLFVNANQDYVQQVLQETSLDMLQFHGDETPEYCRQFQRPYIKAIRVRNTEDILCAQEKFASARALLFDAHVEHLYGGSGQSFDWTLLPEKLSVPWVLSGGLTPENVAAAIRQTGCAAVDISSGVELKKGVKCPDKLSEFFKGVRSV